METGNSWRLITVRNREWKQDTASGVYTVIYWVAHTQQVRVDVMNNVHSPVVSLIGETAEAVYKGLADYLDALKITLSAEHAMYIGKELALCEMHKENYVQS